MKQPKLLIKLPKLKTRRQITDAKKRIEEKIKDYQITVMKTRGNPDIIVYKQMFDIDREELRLRVIESLEINPASL